MLRTYLRRIIPNKNGPAATTTGPFEDTHYVGARMLLLVGKLRATKTYSGER